MHPPEDEANTLEPQGAVSMLAYQTDPPDTLYRELHFNAPYYRFTPGRI